MGMAFPSGDLAIIFLIVSLACCYCPAVEAPPPASASFNMGGREAGQVNAAHPVGGNKVVINAAPVALSASSSVRHVSANSMPSSPQEEATTCFEIISKGFYNSMAAHPDGSDRIFLSTQGGKIWLASVPKRGSGGTPQINGSPFLDLTDRVLVMMSIAFHPEFMANGRLFVSYTCDSRVTPASSCSSPAGNGSLPSQYHLVVAEFSAKGNNDYSTATHANPVEVRRVFSMGLPDQQPDASSYSQQGSGQILFRPTDYDGYLYLVVGHGGEGDLSRGNRTYYGKIITFGVDDSTGPNKAEIYAEGLSDPRGCSFDSERPSDLYCANIDEQQQERVHRISGAYSASVASLVVIDHGPHAPNGMLSIVGGFIYRGLANPSLTGWYLYMYDSSVQVASVVDFPESNDPLYNYNPAPMLGVSCFDSSLAPCSSTGISSHVLYIGNDNNMDAFILTTDGVYRFPPGLCADEQKSSPLWLKVIIVIGSAVGFLASVFGCHFYCRKGQEESDPQQPHCTCIIKKSCNNCCSVRAGSP